MKNLTLRIKKIYLERIISGEKTFEYRDHSPFYRRVFKDRDYDTITFHYQTNRRVRVDVKAIKIIRTPQTLRLSKIPFSSHVFQIAIDNATEYFV